MTTQSAESNHAGLISLRQIAKFFGVGIGHAQSWVAARDLRATETGWYVLDEVRAAIISMAPSLRPELTGEGTVPSVPESLRPTLLAAAATITP